MVSPEIIARAVNIANDLRSFFGEPPIDDLPKGIPSESDRCILARAFNFDCKIHPVGINKTGSWVASFDGHYAEATKFAALLGTTVKSIVRENKSTLNRVEIPTEIAEIARQFDKGLLPQYDETVEWASKEYREDHLQ